MDEMLITLSNIYAKLISHVHEIPKTDHLLRAQWKLIINTVDVITITLEQRKENPHD